MPKADPTRRVAWDVMRAVETRDAYVNLMLPGLITQAGLTGRDAALATELAHGTIRRQASYDAILNAVSSKGIEAVDPPVRDVLRLGVHQLLSLRTPSHAAVSTSVDLVREAVGHKPVAFVNAVLRKVSAADFDTWMSRVAPSAEADPIGRLAVVHSHPRWIVDALYAALGDELGELEAVLAADNAAPRVTLVARPGTTTADLEELAGAGAVPGALSPYAHVLASGQPGELACVRERRVGVQDEGSQLVAIAAAGAGLDGSDERWLDLCAGPGGKAALLAAIGAAQGAAVTANEPQPHRAQLVRDAVAGYPGTTVTGDDGRDPSWADRAFDRVVVDAPCSGLGALRRRPEARWRRSATGLPDLIALQSQLLDAAIGATRPGGLITYATCSPHPDETTGVVQAALARHPGVEPVDATAVLPDIGADGANGPYVQLWPHRHGTDAMFMAVLRRG